MATQYLLRETDLGAGAKRVSERIAHTSERLIKVATKFCVFSLVVIVATIAVFALSAFFGAHEAEAEWIGSGVPFIGPLVDWIFYGEDPVSKFLGGALRDMDNSLIWFQMSILENFQRDPLVTGDLETLFAGINPLFQLRMTTLTAGVHHTAVIPLANVVLIIGLALKFGRLLYEMNTHNAQIDLFQVSMMFVAFFLIKAIIDNSWELMSLIFNLVNSVTRFMNTEVPLYPTSIPTDGALPTFYNNVGALLFLVIPLLLALLVIAVCTTVAKISLIARVVTIYIYLAFSPIPIAQSMTDSGRAAAFTFGKKFAALALSSAIMLFLFALLNLVVSSMALAYVDFALLGPGDLMNFLGGRFLMHLVLMITVIMLIGKSGKFAQDILGVT